MDTLRRGVDCHVKLTNYRKTGELFENLLTMRPVHDSNGVYRFCIGVQFEVRRDVSLKTRLAKLDKLIKLLPASLEVSSRAVGVAHDRYEAPVEQSTQLNVKLEKALAGATVGPAIRNVVVEDGYYADHHIEMLKAIGVSPKWNPFSDLPNGGPNTRAPSRPTGPRVLPRRHRTVAGTGPAGNRFHSNGAGPLYPFPTHRTLGEPRLPPLA